MRIDVRFNKISSLDIFVCSKNIFRDCYLTNVLIILFFNQIVE